MTHRFRAQLTPVESVTVPTAYGDLTFQMRGVRVLDSKGAQVAYFACEDTPEDFDAKALEAGWVRVGYDDGVVFLERRRGRGLRSVLPPRWAGHS